MQLGLGIDTGGTFTDVALYDFNTNKVIDSAKAPTRKENLQKGIEEALDQLDGNLFQKVQFVSLSTTLATNACVENKGANATLILIGSHPKVVEQYGKEYGLPDADQIILLDGTVNDNGEAVKNRTGNIKATLKSSTLSRTVMPSFNLSMLNPCLSRPKPLSPNNAENR